MANTFRVESYRSSKGLSYVVMGILLLQVFCMLASIAFAVGLLLFPDKVLDLDEGESMPIFFVLIGLAAIPEILFRIIGIVIFLVWEHRSYGNLSPLKARNLE